MILYLIDGFYMVTCTVFPLSRFTAHDTLESERIQNRPPPWLTIGLENRLSGIYMQNSTNTTVNQGHNSWCLFFRNQGNRQYIVIRNLAVPHHFVSYLVFFSSIRVDPGPYIVTSPENTYPRGKHREIKVHRSNACAFPRMIMQRNEMWYTYTPLGI
jgi:hypothetical protein